MDCQLLAHLPKYFLHSSWCEDWEVECKVILSKSSWSIDIWTCRWAHKCDLCVVYICIVCILTVCVLHFFLSYCLKWPGLDIKLFNIEGGWAILGLVVYPYHSGSWASESVSSVQRTISRWWHLHVDNFNPYLSCPQSLGRLPAFYLHWDAMCLGCSSLLFLTCFQLVIPQLSFQSSSSSTPSWPPAALCIILTFNVPICATVTVTITLGHTQSIAGFLKALGRQEMSLVPTVLSIWSDTTKRKKKFWD